MNIKYDLNIDDATAFNLYYYSYNPRIRRRVKIYKIIFPFLSFLFLLLGLISLLNYTITYAVGCFVFALLTIYFFIRLTRPMVKRRIKKELIRRYTPGKNTLLGDHEIFITADQIKDIGKMDEGTMRWDVINDVVETEQHLFLLLHASSQACIIPRRAFENNEDFNKFVEMARTYHRAAMESKV